MECDISFKVENFHGAIIKRTKEKGKWLLMGSCDISMADNIGFIIFGSAANSQWDGIWIYCCGIFLSCILLCFLFIYLLRMLVFNYGFYVFFVSLMWYRFRPQI
jgi:hypothetical protein